MDSPALDDAPACPKALARRHRRRRLRRAHLHRAPSSTGSSPTRPPAHLTRRPRARRAVARPRRTPGSSNVVYVGGSEVTVPASEDTGETAPPQSPSTHSPSSSAWQRDPHPDSPPGCRDARTSARAPGLTFRAHVATSSPITAFSLPPRSPLRGLPQPRSRFALPWGILSRSLRRRLRVRRRLRRAGPRLTWRDLVVPRGRAAATGTTPHPSVPRLPWAELLKRVFAFRRAHLPLVRRAPQAHRTADRRPRGAPHSGAPPPAHRATPPRPGPRSARARLRLVDRPPRPALSSDAGCVPGTGLPPPPAARPEPSSTPPSTRPQPDPADRHRAPLARRPSRAL